MARPAGASRPSVSAAVNGISRTNTVGLALLSTAFLERERQRAMRLARLGRLADQAFARGDYDACVAYANQLLSADPERADAHRLVVRCTAGLDPTSV